MTLEEALDFVQEALDQGCLSRVQELVFRKSWEELSYTEIAQSSSYELGYIRDVGYKLWQSLSNALGTKITKSNFRKVIEQDVAASHKLGTSSILAEDLLRKENSSVLNAGFFTNHHHDWGEAVDASVFYGRTAEIATLKHWLIEEHCRLVALLGMGGIGKTALAAKLAQHVQHEFKYLVWRSLRNAPPIEDLVRELVIFLSHRQEVHLTEALDGQISCLMKYLRQHRCLLILDNAESILRAEALAGRYRLGYEGYGQLLRRVADEQHQSCLIITSREKPIGLTAKEGKTLPVRSLELGSLQETEVQEILKVKGLTPAKDESRKLLEYYTGNPLVLKIIATTIQSLFDGDTSKFLEQGKVFFGDIWELLDQHVSRLSPTEKQVMRHLTTTRKPVTLTELLENIVPAISHREMLEALESIQRRSLLQMYSTSFAQHPVIKAYIAERLSTHIDSSEEISASMFFS